MDLGHHYVLTGASITNASPAAQATLAMTPGRARRLADSLDGMWLPPGLVRPGLNFDGTGRLPRDLVPFTWKANVVSGGPRPVLALRLTRDEANDLFSPFRRFPIDRDRGMFFSYVLHDASIHDDDRPGQGPDHRRLRVDATGEMCFEWGRWRHRIEVRRFTAHLDWTFEHVARGLKPGCVMTIDAVDADLPHVPFITDWDAQWRTLEASANKSFAKHLSKHALPEGSPIEALVDGLIGDGVAASASASAEPAAAAKAGDAVSSAKAGKAGEADGTVADLAVSASAWVTGGRAAAPLRQAGASF